MLRTFVAFFCFCFAVSASAKLGETVPQLLKRFGKSYTVEPVPLGKNYKFRSANISVDAIVANGISICETYLSDHPLTASGEPPNGIVRGVLRTNVPKARWIEIDAAPFQADYALRSPDDKYVAILNYKGPQPENNVWTMTVGLAKSVRTLSNTIAPPVNPSPPASTATPASSSSPTPSPFATAAPTPDIAGYHAGDVISLRLGIGEKVVPICTTKDSTEVVENYLNDHWQEMDAAITSLELAERLFTVKEGTHARLLEDDSISKGGYLHVRILDGPEKGRYGYASIENFD